MMVTVLHLDMNFTVVWQMAHISSVTNHSSVSSHSGCPFLTKSRIKTAMDAMPEYSLFLVRILEELDTKYSTVSYQDLCKSLCARFDLVHLAKLRSLLFYTACLDPAFPATLFKDKMRCSVEDQQSKKLMVAADIVTMFNLIKMNGGMVKDKLPMGRRPKFHKNQSFESCRSDTDVYNFKDDDRGYNLMDTRGHHVSRKSPCPKSDCNNFQPFIPTSEPNFLLGVTKDLKCRAASLDKLQYLPQYPQRQSSSMRDAEHLLPHGHRQRVNNGPGISPCQPRDQGCFYVQWRAFHRALVHAKAEYLQRGFP